MRIAAALFAAFVCTSAGAVSAATVEYVFAGVCDSDGCSTGLSFNGVMQVDDAGFEAGQPVDAALISERRFTYGGTNTLALNDGPQNFQAVWGSAPGRLSSLSFQASTALSPDTGFAAWIGVQGDGDGLLGQLTGASRASLVGNCATVLCGEQNFGVPYGNYRVQGLIAPGPALVPLPPAFALILAGIAGLGALSARVRMARCNGVPG